jgi:zinc protease
MGTESQVASWSRPQIVNYFKEAYQPQNIILAVVGDIDSLTAFQEIEKYYGGMASSPLKITPSPAEPLQTDFRYKRLTADINRSIVYLGFHIPGALSDDYYPLLVLDFILSGGRASRLTQEVKEKQGLAEFVNSSCVVYKDFGYFSVDGEQVEGDPQKLLAALIEQVERFKLRNVSDAELTRALNQLESDYLHGLQDVNDQAQKLAYYESYGDYRLADTYLDRLRRVTAADIKRVAQTYFTLVNAAVLEYLPKGKEFNSCTTYQLKRFLADNLSKFRQAPRYAVDDIAPIVTAPPVGGQHLPDQPAQKQVIENGITVICKENHSLPIVSVAAYFLGGAFNETPDNWGVTQLLARTSLKGAGSYSAANIAGDIEGLGGSINSEVTSDYFGFRFESMANNFEECFSIFSRVILDPIFPETELQKEKKDLIAAIQRLKDSTEDYPIELCHQALFEGTAYGAPSLGDIAGIEKIGTTDLINKHRRAVTTGNFVIAYVGDITLDQAVLLTRRHFRDMNVARRATIPALQLKPVAVKTKIEKREKAQTAQAFAFLTCPCYDPDYEPLKLYQNLISGMGGRLWTEVRDRKSLAYTVYAYQEPRALAGSFICFIATSPENALVARDLSLKVISGLKDSLPNSDELQTAKNYTVGMFLIGLQTNSALSDVLAKWELMGRGYESVMEYPQRIRSVNIDSIRNVAAKYFAKKNYGLGMIEGGKSPGRK